MKVSFEELKAQFKRVLLKQGFTEERAALCAQVFAENSRDGVYSHGLNRFPVFVQMVQEGLIDADAEPEKVGQNGVLERWDGHLAPGMYTATKAMQRAIELAKEKGMGGVAVKNTNHWMRAGSYGWQAADAGCVGICATNTIANMPPWGGSEPRLGNNPLVIAIPRKEGHIVLDMAMSQFSYGKLQEYELQGKELPVEGGYDEEGHLSKDPAKIRKTERPLPIGFWKGSGLSLVIDALVASLSGGRSVAQITAAGNEAGVSQLFLCINASNLDETISRGIIEYTKSSQALGGQGEIRYPGESSLATRHRNEKEGIPVNEEIWKQVLDL
ncbi:3-dehydro-L-gulonate 2-dehydrogenase [Pontibacter ummariensis]|uniref:3-dehydro-L-gulonate 2-dehydrogenase n=1 Tax=Pontibacter ummariensis TaxID=1610492 RepID=A0A239GZ61_9BACT|nr:3-dehydro-L-gulonate 2-dehydrogenase [Pontibacter ummariensis]PRY10977.1 3-dehydro-L-gulonate 2-dehydrogenase [Pontibacter ummariensis]SNS73843.1 3-dehydro-L-gulonate 2-dehydrogenase [Pontibacter ummariensis]